MYMKPQYFVWYVFSIRFIIFTSRFILVHAVYVPIYSYIKLEHCYFVLSSLVDVSRAHFVTGPGHQLGGKRV